MFCDNCGSPMQDGQAFCGKCGHGSKKTENSVCCGCGAELTAGAKFCNACGAPVEETKKRFCQFCGTEMSENVQFCVNCGKRSGAKSFILSSSSKNNASESAGWFGGRFKNQFTDAVDGFLAKVSNKLTDVTSSFGGELADRRAASLGWKHALVTVLILFIVILYYLPVLKIQAPTISGAYYNGSFHDPTVTVDTAGVSLGNPFAGILEKGYDADLESFNTVMVVVTLLFDVIPFLLAALFAFLPCIKGEVLKRRKMIFQAFMSIRLLVSVVLVRIISGIAINSSMKNYKEYEELLKELGAMPRVNLTFWGWLMIILAVALIITVFVIKKENKAVMQELDESK